MTAKELLNQIFDGDRQARDAEGAFLVAEGPPGLAKALGEAVEEALGLEDRDEATLRLERLADLCGQISGAGPVDSLLRILNDDEPAIRYAAGEALLEVAYDRYAEVARGIDRALDSGVTGPAMAELPGILGEIGEPGAIPQLRRFLKLHDPDAIAAAIEALAQLRDPASADAIRPFLDDQRVVILDDAERETEASLGELATAALQFLDGS